MRCSICERTCSVEEGKTGACGRYRNAEGRMEEVSPGAYLVVTPVSIETVPLFHFHPGGKFLQITTTGCNFHCNGCVSNTLVTGMSSDSAALSHLSPEEVVARALDEDCMGIAFVMNDPLASFFSFLDVAARAREKGLLVGCSTNAYFTEESLSRLSPFLDFVNIGVKGLSNRIYEECGGSTVAPVIRNMGLLNEAGVHVEVSCMFHRGNEVEVRRLAEIMAGISRDMPLQIMRFIPLEGADQGLEPTIGEAERLCLDLRKHLNHVYLFNSPGSEYLDTICPGCGAVIYRRNFYGPMGARLVDGENTMEGGNRCVACGRELAFSKGQAYREGNFRETDFHGGYPFTRALEMIEAILIASGVRQQKRVVSVWEDMLAEDGMAVLHDNLQTPEKYIFLVRHFGRIAGVVDGAELLASYLEEKLALVRDGRSSISRRPRAYYSMGKPLFHIKGERLENNLLEEAGAESVNKRVKCKGRPGINLTPEKINELDPEYIFISGFLSSPTEEFLAGCREKGIDVVATRLGQVHNFPSPGWDFGSPRWILGLMFMARTMHPDVYDFDIEAEAGEFYRRFYGGKYSPEEINRSFAKPHRNWTWK